MRDRPALGGYIAVQPVIDELIEILRVSRLSKTKLGTGAKVAQPD